MPKEYTLEELLKLRSDWIKEQSSFLRNLVVVVQKFGDPLPQLAGTEREYQYKTLVAHGMEAKFNTFFGSYDIFAREYTHWLFLNVEVHEKKVCRMSFLQAGREVSLMKYSGDDPKINREDFFIVPGEWQKTAMVLIDKLKVAQAKAIVEAEEEERVKLLDQLLIGKEV